MTEPKSSRFIFSAEPSFLAAVDRWRSMNPALPSRAEAIRVLTAVGLLQFYQKAPKELADKESAAAVFKVLTQHRGDTLTDPYAVAALQSVLTAKSKQERKEAMADFQTALERKG